MSAPPVITIGTRGSPLALIQAEEVKARLAAAHDALAEPAAIAIKVIKTTGDRVQDRRLMEIGGKGLFTKEIEEALRDGAIDLAVHSMKDMPTALPEGLEIPCILPREDPRDAFFAREAGRLADLPEGAVVGTSGLRRQAQVLLARPDLRVAPIRGNVDTRLRKLAAGEVDATLLALAGLKRLGRESDAKAVLAVEEMLPAVAQGAIGIEVRADDARTRDFIAAIDHEPSHIRVTAERACLAALDGSCRTPIAALAELDESGGLELIGLVALPDGSHAVKRQAAGPATDAERLGRALGEEIRAAAGPDFIAQMEQWL